MISYINYEIQVEIFTSCATIQLARKGLGKNDEMTRK